MTRRDAHSPRPVKEDFAAAAPPDPDARRHRRDVVRRRRGRCPSRGGRLEEAPRRRRGREVPRARPAHAGGLRELPQARWRARTPRRPTAGWPSSPRSCCPRSTTSTSPCARPRSTAATRSPRASALIQDELVGALGRVGIQAFSPKGEPFDPSEHEAMASQPVEGAEAGTVAEVYQQGYRINGTVLRPARVVVAA